MTSTLDPDTSTAAPRYAETLAEALPDDAKIAAVRAELEAAGVKYVLSCWIDLFGVPKTKAVPMSDFEALCRGRGPQFAVHFYLDVTVKETGERRKVYEVGLYTVDRDKIVEERFFY